MVSYHDCSTAENHENPTIEVDLNTDKVYKLLPPITDKCHDRLRQPFTWRFHLKEQVWTILLDMLK